MSNDKSKFYTFFIFTARVYAFVVLLGFCLGQLPFIYFDVPIFKRKPRKGHVMLIADRIKAKLSTWKSVTFSMVCFLYNFVFILGMLLLSNLYTFGFAILFGLGTSLRKRW